MMKEWATVVSWQQGVALLRCEPKSGCGSCSGRSGCGVHALNELAPGSEHYLQLQIAQPLEPGQRVEIGIAEGSLLRSATLVYMVPLFAVILGGGLLQWLLGSDAAALLGAVLGGMGAFTVVRLLTPYFDKQADFQPVVLQIGLPPGAIRLHTQTEDPV
ncbi:SoxR-reducing system protein RseC [Serratia sp. UGAL515B_01]|uniref:SoxR-reducing system protein RseC n=1 Tax=Serratia sp. UGAL515B_01 TaxID=2986763 RepID=UPI002953B5CE|nr:SoxR-reducing system protein RseC [Serratia sp. UGAL515B_01]WON75913.1 SoxR-reducing system protein RseC [Serratia sp. UGAL515B_01]